MKIIALVKFNDSIAMVLDEIPKLKYQKKADCLLGSNGVFLDTLFYERPDDRWKAFAGRKFDIELDTGEVIHCEGQYWDGVKPIHKSMVEGDIIHVTASTLDNLKKCYVFCGYKGIKHEIQKLMSQYKGIVYEYWDYDRLITSNPYRRRKKDLTPALRRMRRSNRNIRNTGHFKTIK